MSPKMGRPIMGDEPKNKQIAMRVAQSTADKFQKCSELSGKPKVTLFEDMVNALYEKLTKK